MSERLDPKALREAAQARLAAAHGGTLEELHVHQVELEMQHQELQRIYDELEASNRRFRGLFDDAPFPYVETDQRGDITQYNRAAQSLLGIGADQPLRELVAAPQRGGFDELVSTASSSLLSPPSREFLLRTVRGERYVRVSVSCPEEGRALFALEDVTRMRAAREQLAASERRMRSFFDLAPDGIAVMRDTSVVYVNRALCALLQARPDDLMHEGLRGLVMSDADIFATADVPEVEFVLRDLEGGEHAVEARTVEIELDARPARMWIIRDLTERRRMEARVARSERLASFGMLVSGVAHEINNPLSFVIANLEMIIETLEETADEETLELAKDALEGGSRIATIVNDLRSFQRTDDELGPVDVNEVVARTLRMAQPKVAHTTRIRHALGLVPSVVSNEGRLAQVLLNLVLNAAQAMPERPMEDNRVEVRTWAKDGEVCLLVEDNGNGIPKDKLRYLFDPFFTTRKHSGGTGLGLAISNGIVQQMGGFIDVQSEVGKGSRFVVHLPISRTASESKIRRPPTLETQAPPTEEMRILVVDDEPAVARVLVRTLKSFGPVEVLDSGRAAQAHLADRADYHVILCDLVMDNGSGDELLRWLKDNRPELVPRIAFMSGMPHPEQRTPGKRPLLHKPFDLAEVRKVVRSLGHRALRDESPERAESTGQVDLSSAEAFPPVGP